MFMMKNNNYDESNRAAVGVMPRTRRTNASTSPPLSHPSQYLHLQFRDSSLRGRLLAFFGFAATKDHVVGTREKVPVQQLASALSVKLLTLGPRTAAHAIDVRRETAPVTAPAPTENVERFNRYADPRLSYAGRMESWGMGTGTGAPREVSRATGIVGKPKPDPVKRPAAAVSSYDLPQFNSLNTDMAPAV